ncbi:MAG TPA: hypothetical protein VFS41_01845 [Edaphobacter sp.]|nr:hypothetical protein [Edaphobacter sp.]
MTIIISPKQRDLLYDQILVRLSGIHAVWLAARNEDFETADRLGHADTARTGEAEPARPRRAVRDIGFMVEPDRERRLRPDLGKYAPSCEWTWGLNGEAVGTG